MFYDKKRNVYIGDTSTGKTIAVTPDVILRAIQTSIATHEDINFALLADTWAYLAEPDTHIYELEQLEDTGMCLEEALLEVEELRYVCERKRKSQRVKVTVSSEQKEDYSVSFANIAMAYAGMHA